MIAIAVARWHFLILWLQLAARIPLKISFCLCCISDWRWSSSCDVDILSNIAANTLNIMIYNTLFTFIILQVTAGFVLSFINIPSSSIEAQTSMTCLMTSHQPSLHSRYIPSSISAVPPPISIPVWSLSSPVSTSPNDSYLRSRMSILTYVTPGK